LFRIEHDTPLLRYISSFNEENPPVCNNYCTGRAGRVGPPGRTEKNEGKETDKSVEYVVVDPLTCRILLSWYIEKITSKVIKNYITFICSNKIYTVDEVFVNMDLSIIPDNSILNVIKQIFEILNLLSPYDFSISDTNNLFVIDKNFSVK